MADRRARGAGHPRRGRQLPDRLRPARRRARGRATPSPRSIEIIRRRIDLLGTKEPDIRQQGTDRIAIEAPGESDPQKLKDVIGQTAKLTFQMVDESLRRGRRGRAVVPPDDKVLPYTRPSAAAARATSWSSAASAVDGEMLTHAQQGFDQQTNTPVGGSSASTARAPTASARSTTENIGKRVRHRARQQGDLGAADHQSRSSAARARSPATSPIESATPAGAAAQLRRAAGAAEGDRAEHRGRRPGRRRGAGRGHRAGHRRGADLRLHHPGLWPVRRLRGRSRWS